MGGTPKRTGVKGLEKHCLRGGKEEKPKRTSSRASNNQEKNPDNSKGISEKERKNGTS